MAKDNVNLAWHDIYDAADAKELVFQLLTLLVKKNLITQKDANDLVGDVLWVGDDSGQRRLTRAITEVKNGKVQIKGKQ